MWSEASKQCMRKAAHKAGLIRQVDSDALTIILEPEAAALHAMQTNAPPLREGNWLMTVDAQLLQAARFLFGVRAWPTTKRAPPRHDAPAAGMTVCVLDVGGGTADVTVHHVEHRGQQLVLSEKVSATGALCGSVYVDQAFRRVQTFPPARRTQRCAGRVAGC